VGRFLYMARWESSPRYTNYRETHKLYQRSINYNIKRFGTPIRGLENRVTNLSTSKRVYSI
jgi:hypothetical protein